MKYQRLQLTWHRLLAQISMPWSSWIMGPKLGHFGVKCSTRVAVRSYGLRLRTRPPLKPLWVRGGRGERGLIRSSRFHRVTTVCTGPWKEHVKFLASIPEKKEPLLQHKPEPSIFELESPVPFCRIYRLKLHTCLSLGQRERTSQFNFQWSTWSA